VIRIGKRPKWTYEEVKKCFDNGSCKLLTSKEEYKNTSQKLDFICSCGNKSIIDFQHFYYRGHRCHECAIKKLSKTKTLTYEEVKHRFEEKGCVLLSKEYISSRDKLEYLCHCGNKTENTLGNFLKSKGCMKCAGTPKYKYNYIYTYFKEQGCELLSKEYENAGELLDYICICGTLSKITFGNFQAGHRCKNCRTEKVANIRRIPYEKVYNYFKKYNCELLTDNYINGYQQLLKYKCSCGNVLERTFTQFKRYKTCDNCRDSFKNKYNEKTILPILNNLIQKLLDDKIIDSIDDIPKKVNHKIFKQYGLVQLLNRIFRGSTYEIINYIFPDKWHPWEFKHVPNKFWKDTYNHKLVWEWFIQQLIKDNIIKEEKDIIHIIDGALLSKYGLAGLYNIYSKNTYKFLSNFIDCYEWELKQVPSNFWDEKENRIKAMKQYINKNNILLEDISNIFTYLYCEIHKFGVPLKKYYNCNIHAWIDECYPGIFKSEEFNLYIASDGTKLKSCGELIIHEYLISIFSNVIYYRGNNNSIKWHNEDKDENYIADWLINDNIIIEYFGMYCKTSKLQHIKNYIIKTDNKIEYFNKLDKYNFISLFPKDLNQNLKGVKEKLQQYI
jgi:hypothetical protein